MAAQRIALTDSDVRVRSDLTAHILIVIKRIALVAVDIGAVNLAFYLAWFARYRLGLVVDLDPGNYVEHGAYIPLQIALSLTFAFILGLVPLVVASGAGAITRQAVGTPVFGGMLAASLFGIFIIPLLYVTAERLQQWRRAKE